MIMAFFFGIGWGYMTVRSRSVIPAMISHYLVDSIGLIVLNVDGSDQALATGYFLLLTLLFPVFTIILTKALYNQSPDLSSATIPTYENLPKERT
jgi:membrane protease YdiL (CAAX protease family)